MPVAGLWWNPDESGKGNNVKVQHGVTVVTMHSHAADGDPLGYLMVGMLVNAGAGVAVSGTLEKYRGGQCASCLYRAPVHLGGGGGMTVAFASSNAAIVQRPGGRTTQIQPAVW
jgi:hypothetical protein